MPNDNRPQFFNQDFWKRVGQAAVPLAGLLVTEFVRVLTNGGAAVHEPLPTWLHGSAGLLVVARALQTWIYQGRGDDPHTGSVKGAVRSSTDQ